jgi:hypothetical protein
MKMTERVMRDLHVAGWNAGCWRTTMETARSDRAARLNA